MRTTALSIVLLIGLAAAPLRGDLIEFELTGNAGSGLLEGNVTPPSGSSGSGGEGFGGIVFDTLTNILHVHVEWGSANGFGNLTGDVTMLHLHGPTPDGPPDSFSQTGQLIVVLSNSLSFNARANDGGVNDAFFIQTQTCRGCWAAGPTSMSTPPSFRWEKSAGIWFSRCLNRPAAGWAWQWLS